MTQRYLHGLAATCPLIRINMHVSRDLWFSLPLLFQKVTGSVIAFRMPTHWDAVHKWVTRYSIFYIAFKHLTWEYFDLFNANWLEWHKIWLNDKWMTITHCYVRYVQDAINRHKFMLVAQKQNQKGNKMKSCDDF